MATTTAMTPNPEPDNVISRAAQQLRQFMCGSARARRADALRAGTHVAALRIVRLRNAGMGREDRGGPARQARTPRVSSSHPLVHERRAA